MSEAKVGLPSHSTEVDMTSSWDNGANERRVDSPSTRAYFRRIYAWLDNGSDETVKSSYRFIHHMVAADGTPGAANFRALAAGIAALNGSRSGTVLDDSGRNAVHRHLASHYEDAGRQAPPLLAKSEIDSIYSLVETKSSELSVGQTVSVDNVEGIIYGTIMEINGDEAAIREWTFTDEEWLPSDAVYDFPLEEAKQENFLTMGLEDDVQEYSEEVVPSGEKSEGIDNVTNTKSKDYEMTEQDFEVLVKSIAKLVIAEIGVKIDATVIEEKQADEAAIDAPAIEKEVKSEEVAEEVVAEEEVVAAEEATEVVEEAAAEEAVAEEAPTACANEEHVDGCCEVPEEKAAFLTLNDLKEFSDLLDML